MHKRISYHFLADLHITRHSRETESEKRIRNTLNKTCSVELVTSRNRNYRPYVISGHSFFLNILLGVYNYGRILLNSIISRGKKYHGVWVCMNHWRRFKVEKAWFSEHMWPFPSIFQIYITIICSPVLLIHFFCYFGKRRRFLPPGTYAFPTSSVHVRLDTVFNQIW